MRINLIDESEVPEEKPIVDPEPPIEKVETEVVEQLSPKKNGSGLIIVVVLIIVVIIVAITSYIIYGSKKEK